MSSEAANDGWLIGDLRRESSERAGTQRVERLLGVPGGGHVLFVPTPAGYEIAEVEGPPPAVGESVRVGVHAYRAAGLRRSPFPRDDRPCIVLEPAPDVEPCGY